MHTDSGMIGISFSGYMPYMTVASLEMSDEPKNTAKTSSSSAIKQERLLPCTMTGNRRKQIIKANKNKLNLRIYHYIH